MKLKKYSKNEKIKTSIILSSIILVLVVSGITLYRTFAMYHVKESFNVLTGRIPNFNVKNIDSAIEKTDEENIQ